MSRRAWKAAALLGPRPVARVAPRVLALVAMLAVPAVPAWGQDAGAGATDDEATLLAPSGVLEAVRESDLLTVTLEEAIARAQSHSPAIAQADAALTGAEVSHRAAVGSFLPSLNFSSGASLSSQERFNPQTNTTVTGSNDSYNAGISSSIDLFTGGRKTAELRDARVQVEVAEESKLEQSFAVALATKRTFFTVLRAEELMRVAEARVQRAEQAREAAQRRLDVGSATRSDVLRARLELNNAHNTLLQSESDRRAAAFALGRLVGVAGPVGARSDGLPARPTELAIEEAELVEIVVGSAPSVRTADAAVRSTRAGAQVARSQYFPSLRVTGGYSWFNQDAAFTGGRTSWTSGVGLSFPIFNGFQREANVARADAQVSLARTRLEDARRAARSELERLLGAVRLAEQQIELAGEAVEVSQEDLRVQEERYRLGASTILDLLTSQFNLIQAEQSLIGARFDYQIARAELEALAGREL